MLALHTVLHSQVYIIQIGIIFFRGTLRENPGLNPNFWKNSWENQHFIAFLSTNFSQNCQKMGIFFKKMANFSP